jgi:hypothetical protein
MEKVIDFINVHRDRYLDELKGLLAIPSISALPEHAADVRRCAEWCGAEMGRVGLQNVRLIDTPGFPVVYGDWLGAEGAPTILFYGHYDVSRSIRWSCGSPLPLKRRSATARFTRAGPRTTRGRCSCTSRPSKRT